MLSTSERLQKSGRVGPSLLSREPLVGAQIGMLIAIASWAMLFGTFALSLLIARARVSVWPPVGSEPVPKIITTLAVLVAIGSTFIYHKAYQRLRSENDLYAFKQGLSITLMMGCLFLALQALTWYQLIGLEFRVSKGLFDSIVYSLIGFHGLHVLGGMGSLLWLFKNCYFPNPRLQGGYSSQNCIAPQLVGWFWHFLGVVWVIFYALLVWL